MSLESDLYTVLAAVQPAVYPDVAPPGAAVPYITWQQVGGDVVRPVDGLPDKRNAVVQINCWAATRDQANAMALAVEAALVAATVFQARPVAAFMAAFDDDVELRGAMQDFSIWAAR